MFRSILGVTQLRTFPSLAAHWRLNTSPEDLLNVSTKRPKTVDEFDPVFKKQCPNYWAEFF
jgi:hypothetical protein